MLVKQARFGGDVVVHITVIIEVIASDIGECRDREAHRIGASLVQRVG